MSINKDNPLHNPFHTIDNITGGVASFIPGYDAAAYPGRLANSVDRMATGKQSVGSGLVDIGMNTAWGILSVFDATAIAGAYKSLKAAKAIEVGEELPKVAEYGAKSGGRLGSKLKSAGKVGVIIGGGIGGSIGQAYLHQKDEAGLTIQQDIHKDDDIRNHLNKLAGRVRQGGPLRMTASDKYHQNLKYNKKKSDLLYGKPGDKYFAYMTQGGDVVSTV